MIFTSLQKQTIINIINHINIDQPFKMADVNYVLIPFEGNINTGYPTVLKLHPQETKDIDK